MDLKDYLEEKGLSVMQVGNNLQANCPFCDDDRQRFGINNNPNHAYYGYWNCLNGGCDEKGRSIKSLQKQINKLNGDNERAKIELKKPSNDSHEDADIDQTKAAKYYNNIEKKDRKAKDYLMDERGFSIKTIKHFMLGSWKKKSYEYVSLPFWEDGILVNIKFRAINFKDKSYKWRRITGGKSSLFHDEVLDNQDIKEIFLCEAELDAIALWNAGFKNVVAVTTGAKAMQPEWYERLERFERINLVFDNDVDGQDGAEKMAKRLGMNRCYNIVLPQDEIKEDGKKKILKDANQYFWDKDSRKERYKASNFKKLVSLSKQFQVKAVLSLTEAYRELIKIRHTADEDELLGYTTQWTKINKILPRSKPGFLVVITANPKVGKCLKFDSTILNPETLELITIEKAIQYELPLIHSLNEETKKIEISRISDWYDSGIKPLLRVTTKLGTKTEPTYHHPYLTFNGWKCADKLKVGDYIATPKELPFFGNSTMSDDRLFVVANLIADGGLTGTSPLWTKKDIRLRQLMRLSISREFGLDSHEVDSYTLRFTDGNSSTVNTLMKYCRELDICKLSKDKTIPKPIFGLKKNLLAKFLGYLWSADGSVYIENDSGKLCVEYSSASEKLIDELQHLFLRFGIQLKKRYKIAKCNGKEFDSWILSPGQSETVFNFHKSIPLVSYKKNILDSGVLKLKSNGRDYITSFPSDIWGLIKNICKDKNKSMAWLGREINNGLPLGFKTKGNCSFKLLIRINNVLKDNNLNKYIKGDICFVRINSIEEIGKHQCYDLTVPGNHNFICNDTIVHNTSWVMDWFLGLGKHGIPSYIECCEMRQLRMAEKTIANALPDFTNVDDLTELQIRQARFQNPADIMYLGYPEEGTIELEAMCEKITNVVRRYGVKVVCFDHLHFLVRGENVRDKIGEVTRRFKLLAEQLGILFVLIAQPRKVENNRIPTANDLKDSSSIYQDLDSLVILHRRIKMDDDYGDNSNKKETGKMESVTEVHVTSRWGEGGACLLNFNGRKAKYYESGIGYDKAVLLFREKYGFNRKGNKKGNRR